MCRLDHFALFLIGSHRRPLFEEGAANVLQGMIVGANDEGVKSRIRHATFNRAHQLVWVIQKEIKNKFTIFDFCCQRHIFAVVL
jgi:hypothetical protein